MADCRVSLREIRHIERGAGLLCLCLGGVLGRHLKSCYVSDACETLSYRQPLMVCLWSSGEKNETDVEVICIEVNNYTGLDCPGRERKKKERREEKRANYSVFSFVFFSPATKMNEYPC